MDWKDLVGKVAPMLGGSLGGPFGAMAGKWLADKLGVQEAELPQVVESADPTIMLKIKELDNDFKVEMKKLGLSEAQLHAADRDSARQLAAKTTIWPQVALSIVYDTAFCIICVMLFTKQVTFSPTQENIVMYVMGILSAALVQVNNFWFGSSAGSKEKTAKLTGK